MAITGISAVGAIGAAPVSAASAPPATGPTFDQMMGQVVSDAVGTLQAGESAAIQGVRGAMPALKVVDAVMGAQRTLQQALAIRDKAVSAYQEISRMAI
jgi:flagellar hook-basal body complex protein FliE